MDRHPPSLQCWNLFVSRGFARSTFIPLTAGSRYVAMQAMQEENYSADHVHHSSPNGYSENTGPSHRKQGTLQMRDTAVTVAGMLLPLLTRFGHHRH